MLPLYKQKIEKGGAHEKISMDSVDCKCGHLFFKQLFAPGMGGRDSCACYDYLHTGCRDQRGMAYCYSDKANTKEKITCFKLKHPGRGVFLLRFAPPTDGYCSEPGIYAAGGGLIGEGLRPLLHHTPEKCQINYAVK